MIEDVKQYLHTGVSKSIFGVETDCLLSQPENTERERVIANFQDFFQQDLQDPSTDLEEF